MRNYADIDYLHARIYAMRGRLLTLGGYASIVRERQTALLKPGDLNRAGENMFREQIAPVIALACAYDKYAPLFIAFLRLFETRNAKILLARAYGRKSLNQWYDIGPFATLERELLEKNLSPEDLKPLISKTFYSVEYKELSGFLRMAINLDISAAANLYNSSSLLSGAARKEFQEMALRRIATLTVIWSRRLKSYYKWSDEQIGSYLQKFESMIDGNVQSHVRVIEEAQNRQLETIRKGGGSEPSIIDIENNLEQGYYSWVSSMFHREFHSIYCVVAYLWLLFTRLKTCFAL